MCRESNTNKSQTISGLGTFAQLRETWLSKNCLTDQSHVAGQTEHFSRLDMVKIEACEIRTEAGFEGFDKVQDT